MSKILSNSFTSYELTEEQVLQGSIFNILQKQVLQNHLATFAEEKLALDYTPEAKDQFLQKEAYLKAKIDLVRYLLDSSTMSEELLSNKITSGE